MIAARQMAASTDQKRALLVSVSACIGFCLLAALVAGGRTEPFDSAFRTAVHASAAPNLTLVATIFSFLGRLSVLLPATGAAAIYLSVKSRRFAGLAPVITMGGALVLNWALKAVVHRARPLPFYGLDPDSFSFPSGHVFFACCFCGAMMLTLGRETKLSIPTCTTFVLAVAWSRVYLGVHFPTDVIAGLLAGIGWVGALYRLGLFKSEKLLNGGVRRTLAVHSISSNAGCGEENE